MKKNNTAYYLGIGILKDDKIKVLFNFKGTYKDTLNFLNKNIVILQIRGFNKDEIYLNFSYNENIEPIREEFNSLIELEGRGILQ